MFPSYLTYSLPALASSGEALTFNGVFKGLVDLCKGKSQHDAFSVGADLNSTLKFLKKNEISRHTVGGHVFFKNNDPVERELKIGGTMKIKMKSATAEGVPTSNFEDIPYGFTIRKKSAVLLNAEQADVDLLITQKTPIPLEEGGYEEGYDVNQLSQYSAPLHFLRDSRRSRLGISTSVGRFFVSS